MLEERHATFATLAETGLQLSGSLPDFVRACWLAGLTGDGDGLGLLLKLSSSKPGPWQL